MLWCWQQWAFYQPAEQLFGGGRQNWEGRKPNGRIRPLRGAETAADAAAKSSCLSQATGPPWCLQGFTQGNKCSLPPPKRRLRWLPWLYRTQQWSFWHHCSHGRSCGLGCYFAWFQQRYYYTVTSVSSLICWLLPIRPIHLLKCTILRNVYNITRSLIFRTFGSLNLPFHKIMQGDFLISSWQQRHTFKLCSNGFSLRNLEKETSQMRVLKARMRTHTKRMKCHFYLTNLYLRLQSYTYLSKSRLYWI